MEENDHQFQKVKMNTFFSTYSDIERKNKKTHESGT